MSDRQWKSSATKFLDAHPELRRAMRDSKIFDRIKQSAALLVDDEEFYVVKGDVLGDADELFLDALAEGRRAETADQTKRALFLELDDRQRTLLDERFGNL
ncbi:MAG TPA: hypothetical protein VK308_06390 [Pyrinomonadaceae bacterium]|nr:hypothetical protein [Pyrinomonadaceae bacterium]